MNIPLYVMIPSAGRPELLTRTLASLAACENTRHLRQVFVIENGQPFGAEQLVTEFSRRLPIRYLYCSRSNKSAALNFAITHINTGCIFFADDDVRFHVKTLEAYATAAQAGPGCFFGGPYGVDYENPPPDWLIPYLPGSAKGWSLPDGQTNLGSKLFMGFNWAAFAENIRDAGGFNEMTGPGLEMTGQEMDMQERLISHGCEPRYVPAAWVWHYVPPARCSPEWALDRARRNTRRWGYGVGCKFGFPHIVLRRAWWTLHPRRPFWRIVAQLNRNSPDVNFKAKHWDARHRGALEGFAAGAASRRFHESHSPS